MSAALVEYRVRAYNTATDSENKIHDNAVAQRFGFRGGLVPGVDVYAYVTHAIVARWGRAWLEHGAAGIRFLTPVYDGEDVVISGAVVDGGIEMAVRNPSGDLCATARATLPAAVPFPQPAAYPRAPLPAEPPRASPATLVPGSVLGSFDSRFDADRAPAYLADIRETLPIYREERIAHPAYLLRNANYILRANVTLGPWIHAGSDVRHFDVARDADAVSVRGRVTRTYEKKGHQFVELDLLMVANDVRPLLHVTHTAIYEPRQSGA